MKKYEILILMMVFNACNNHQKEYDKKIIQQPVDNTLIETKDKANINEETKFTRKEGEAVLIGEKIELLNEDLDIVADISNLSGSVVRIIGISDSLYNQGEMFEEFCKSFWYVKIQIDTIDGVVNGRQVFEIQNSSQDTVFTIDNHQVEILTTNFLGMGVVYEGDLMGCPVDQPVLIKDERNNYFGLVDLIQNEYSKEASWDNEYPFFEIRNDDGCFDKIESINSEGKDIKLKIHRRFQEPVNDYEVLLTFTGNKYKAEYLNFGELRYE